MKNLESMCLKVQNSKLLLLDQTQLPHKEDWISIEGVEDMIHAIKRLAIRGAPAIGVAAACALALEAEKGANYQDLTSFAHALNDSRPTAVNLMMAMDRMILKVEEKQVNREFLVHTAESVFEEDVQLCLDMARTGADYVQDGDQIITHCNTGGLATVGIGTALGVLRYAHEAGKKIHVYVDETRPLLQGGRLTAWECAKIGIPYSIICDNMAGSLMKKGKVNKVFLGSDRVARNGDFANKIGTYPLAVLSQFHKVEFYPVAPYTTIDFECPNGEQIPIEQRDAEEVRGVKGSFGSCSWAPTGSSTFNPAFDVTGHELVTKFIFNHGAFSPEELEAGKHLNRLDS